MILRGRPDLLNTLTLAFDSPGSVGFLGKPSLRRGFLGVGEEVSSSSTCSTTSSVMAGAASRAS
ncbi:hypothetical protein ABTD78_20470, partial [Acinetobacter baumannii]